MSRAAEELLALIHNNLAKKLLELLDSGEAKASDFNVIRQFLKDNGIDSAPKAKSPLSELADRSLPSFSDDPTEGFTPH
ncbi:hypothetical protein [Nitrincola sp. A-D6]|uniref:hypothetical protein n=1 Tax=Nitrincola sp. A-D6 TaxID=1545442 RepID=UPI00055D927E|nr:hypothetical protein [Nitrincola sp. A-D6]